MAQIGKDKPSFSFSRLFARSLSGREKLNLLREPRQRSVFREFGNQANDSLALTHLPIISERAGTGKTRKSEEVDTGAGWPPARRRRR